MWLYFKLWIHKKWVFRLSNKRQLLKISNNLINKNINVD